MCKLDMDARINELKINFTKILDLKNENVKTFSILEAKICKLKDFYSEFVKTNKNNLFIFGLDSFHFQGKLIDIEYEDIQRLYSAITNRIYCEYFKLYKIIVQYILDNVIEQKIIDLVHVNNNYPIYKDLEPFKKYDFEIIQSLHEFIIILLNSINGFLMNKEHDLKRHQIKNNIGLNIDNFVNTFQFNNVILREQLILFISYIEFFHKLHLKYLTRFTTKMHIFFSQITNDIKFEDTSKMNKMKRDSILETFDNENMNNDVIIELKNSISGESSKDGKLVEDIQIIPNLQNIFLDVNEENKIDEIDDNMSAITIESNIKNNSLEENILEENILEENILEENILVEEKSLAEENILVEEKSMAEEKSLAEETLDPPVTLANSPEKKKRVYKPRKK
jgi:hypothetical protein